MGKKRRREPAINQFQQNWCHRHYLLSYGGGNRISFLLKNADMFLPQWHDIDIKGAKFEMYS